MISAEFLSSCTTAFGSPSFQTELKDATDYELAQRASGGEMAAFEEIYERHYRYVYALCLRMTGSATEAEDLTQEVFIQLFRKVGSFRGESAFKTWLHRLTINFVTMHFRKRSVKYERTTPDGETPMQIANGTANPNQMPVVDRIALDKAIAQLAPGYRMVFLLHDVEGYQHDEIADMMGCTIGASKSQLHKARMKLRTLLSKRKALRCAPQTGGRAAVIFQKRREKDRTRRAAARADWR